MTSLIDNDVVLKASCYGLVDELLMPICTAIPLAGVLGTARFVLPRRIRRIGLSGGTDLAVARLESLLSSVETVEPTDQEQQAAADFELAAQRAGLNLDVGESQLCAVAVGRDIPQLLTGDKRAIAAMEALLDYDVRLATLHGRICSLEQIVFAALRRNGEGVRTAICNQPSVDKTLTICSGCRNEWSRETMVECLQSYIEDLRKQAYRVMTR
jgi:hypothetical protein